MKNLIKEHIKKFGIEPNIIGMFWDDPEAVMDGIADAIDDGKLNALSEGPVHNN